MFNLLKIFNAVEEKALLAMHNKLARDIEDAKAEIAEAADELKDRVVALEKKVWDGARTEVHGVAVKVAEATESKPS